MPTYPDKIDYTNIRGPLRLDAGEWYTAQTSGNLTAATLTVLSAGADCYHYITNFSVCSPSAQLITLQEGNENILHRAYIEAAKTYEWILLDPLRCPTVGQTINILSNVSATTYWTIAGFFKKL